MKKSLKVISKINLTVYEKDNAAQQIVGYFRNTRRLDIWKLINVNSLNSKKKKSYNPDRLDAARLFNTIQHPSMRRSVCELEIAFT